MPPRTLDAASSLDRPPTRGRVVAWLAVALWSVVIWQLGGEDFSAPETQSTLIEVLRWLGLELEQTTQERLLFLTRKAAHGVEYGVLAVLVSHAVWRSDSRRHRVEPTSFATLREEDLTRKLIWVSLASVLALAIADETRQAYSISRTGSVYDVLLDAAGGIVALTTLKLGLRARTRRSAPGALTAN